MEAVPREFGSPSTLHQYFQEWAKKGVFFRLWKEARGAAGRGVNRVTAPAGPTALIRITTSEADTGLQPPSPPAVSLGTCDYDECEGAEER